MINYMFGELGKNQSPRLDHRGLWVQIPSGARIFSEFSKHLIYHVFVVSSEMLLTVVNRSNDHVSDW